MSSQIIIDLRFLTPKTANRFKKKNLSTFKEAYIKVLENLENPSVLPYLPKLYIFPFVLQELIMVSTKEANLHTSFATNSVDPSDLTKLAIFAPIYLKRLPFKELTYSLAHEIAHFVQRNGSVDKALENMIPLLGKGRLASHEAIERSAIKKYNIFKGGFRKKIIQSDKELGKYKKILTTGAKIMKHQDFLKYSLGDKFNDLVENVKNKFKEEGALP